MKDPGARWRGRGRGRGRGIFFNKQMWDLRVCIYRSATVPIAIVADGNRVFRGNSMPSSARLKLRTVVIMNVQLYLATANSCVILTFVFAAWNKLSGAISSWQYLTWLGLIPRCVRSFSPLRSVGIFLYQHRHYTDTTLIDRKPKSNMKRPKITDRDRIFSSSSATAYTLSSPGSGTDGR